jgi:hypothetical protein
LVPSAQPNRSRGTASMPQDQKRPRRKTLRHDLRRIARPPCLPRDEFSTAATSRAWCGVFAGVILLASSTARETARHVVRIAKSCAAGRHRSRRLGPRRGADPRQHRPVLPDPARWRGRPRAIGRDTPGRCSRSSRGRGMAAR